jgi:hypothetical protein
MFTKTAMSNISSSAMAGSGFHHTAFDKRDVGETHSARVWREELAKMMEANLHHLDVLRDLGGREAEKPWPASGQNDP